MEEEYNPTAKEEKNATSAYFKHQRKLRLIPFYRQYNAWKSKREVWKLAGKL